jgi:hypothetical protein
VFVEDPNASIDFDMDGYGIKDLRRSGEPWAEVAAYLAYHKRINQAEFMLSPGEDPAKQSAIRQLRAEEADARRAMLLRLANETEEEDECFCRSGETFGKCCITRFS